ncbi:MAG: phosphoenolpyruvate synthase [Pseudomonadales bacterium]
MSAGYIRWFEEIGSADVALVGGKNASLGEMYRNLAARNVPVPNGYAITVDAYRDLLASNALEAPLAALLSELRDGDTDTLQRVAARCRELIYEAPLPAELQQQIEAAQERLLREYGAELTVAVRSSATAEDLPGASFAGQHESYLNVRGGVALLEACRRCFASLFTDRAVQYRMTNGFDHLKVALSIGVMKMVRSDLAASGVLFTLDTESGFRDVVLVTAAYGLGENVVQGAVDPDEFYVHKPTLALGYRHVIRRRLGDKELRMVYATRKGGVTTHNLPTAPDERQRFAITDAEVVQLAEMAARIEQHYSERAGHDMPMDIEWAKDGEDGRLYIVQARPETVASRRQPSVLENFRLLDHGDVLTSGRAVGQKVASARVRVVRTVRDLLAFQNGEVLVAETTTPDWGAVMRKAAALVTNRGGRTCHAAIVARELDIPAVVGCGDATDVLKDGDLITVACCEGETGRVYSGALRFERDRTDLSKLPRPRTRIMINMGNPDIAFRTAALPNDGVGLARLEFIITDAVKAHPMAAAHPDRISSAEERRALERLAANHSDPAEYFVATLAEGVATIAAAFHPKPVIVRMSDFKTNEYARLLGGVDFEPEEPNPMLGFRGASRYAHPAYADGFALECRAMQRVRRDMGFSNVKLMIPFCRRLDEGRRVLDSMAAHGLQRGIDGLEVYVMCEIPNNVLLIDEFAKLFDGFSIGSNDLTQLTLGVDRDSETVAFDFDERDPGVLKMLELAVTGARRNGRHSGICGQAPSDYAEVAEFLVRLGIDSLSLNPDSVLATTRRVLDLEARLGPWRNDA